MMIWDRDDGVNDSMIYVIVLRTLALPWWFCLVLSLLKRAGAVMVGEIGEGMIQ